MAHAQKPDFVFRRNGRVHSNRQGMSVQSTTGSRGVRFSGSNAGYTMFRGNVKSTGYPLHSPVSTSLPLPCVTVCHHISNAVYCRYSKYHTFCYFSFVKSVITLPVKMRFITLPVKMRFITLPVKMRLITLPVKMRLITLTPQCRWGLLSSGTLRGVPNVVGLLCVVLLLVCASLFTHVCCFTMCVLH